MFAATSVLQQQAAEIRNLNPNWSSYLQLIFGILVNRLSCVIIYFSISS
jgi:hypothetical protein